MPGVRYQVSQVSGARYQVLGVRYQVSQVVCEVEALDSISAHQEYSLAQ